MRHFVYYSSGSCNQGDHDWGLREFDSEQDAKKFAWEYEESHPEAHVTVISGFEVVV